MVAVFVWSTGVGSAQAASAKALVAEDAFSVTERLPDGRLRSRVSPVPERFETPGGVWRSIDTSLKPRRGGVLSADSVDGSLEVPRSLKDPLVVGHRGRELSVRLRGAAGKRGRADGREVRFSEVMDGVDAVYSARAQGFKETLIVDHAAAGGDLTYEVRGDAAWSARVDDSGAVVFESAAGTPLFIIRAPLAWDSAQDPVFTDKLALSVKQAQPGHWIVSLQVDAAWLKDAQRVWPVSIDPDVTWANGTTTIQGTTADCYVASGGQANYNFCGLSYMHTGTYNRYYNSLIKWDLSSIPAGATVSSSQVKLFHPPASPHLTGNHRLKVITADWDPATVTWNKRDATTAWTTGGGDVTTDSALISPATPVLDTGWYQWTAPTAAVQGWVDGSLPNYGFRLSTDSGAPNNVAYTWATDEASPSATFPATQAERPILEVTWSMPDTTPPALSISGELATDQQTWRTLGDGDISLSATDAGTGVLRVELNDGSQILDEATQTCTAGGCSMTRPFIVDLAALGDGVHELTAAAVDGAGLRTEQPFTVRVDRGPPSVDLSGELVDDQATAVSGGTRQLSVDATDAGAGVTGLELRVDGSVTGSATQACAAGGCAMQHDFTVDASGLADGTHEVTVVATDGAGRTKTSATVDLTVSSYPVPQAPALSDTEVTPFTEQVSFLYSGPGAVQTGMNPAILDARRQGVITGKVFNGDGVPAPGVTVSVADHPEYGQTVSRDTGEFFLVVNGGEQLRLHYEVQGALASEREVLTKWNDYVVAPDVRMVSLDPAGTSVTFGAGVTTPQLAQSSVVSDADGSRSVRVYVRPGTQASKQLSNGTTEPLTGGTLRVTEFTVGEGGPERMPASLPDTTAYTWAADFRIDEAEQPGVEHVLFDKPVVAYADDIIGAPVGVDIPVGSYEPSEGAWAGDPDGRVVKILDEVAGKAVLDVTGLGAATQDELDYFGIDDDELTMLANEYAPGKVLWRFEMPHFSTIDGNHGMWIRIRDEVKKLAAADQDGCCNQAGSIIGVQNQSLGETAGLGGTPYSLRYDSTRTPGAIGGRSLRVPITNDTVPDDLESVTVSVVIAGQQLTFVENDPQPAQQHTFHWDGNDVFGRPMIGGAVADVAVGHSYQEPYAWSAASPRVLGPTGGGSVGGQWMWVTPPYFGGNRTVTWGRFGTSSAMDRVSAAGATTPAPSRPSLQCNSDDTYCWYDLPEPRDMPAGRDVATTDFRTTINVPYHDARSAGVGGWGVSVQHRYDTATGTLFTGDGQRQSARGSADIISTVRDIDGTGNAGDLTSGYSFDIAVLADGSTLRSERTRHRVLRDWPDGHTTVFAGDINRNGNSGDGGQAVDASLSAPNRLAVGPDQSVYIADIALSVQTVRKVAPDGTITTVAGNGGYADGPNVSDPRQVALGSPSDIAVAPDGTLYIAAAAGLFALDPSGAMAHLVGYYGFGCGRPGDQCQIIGPQPFSVAVAPDGTIYWVADKSSVDRLYRLSPGEAQPTQLMSTFHGGYEPVEGPIGSSNLVPRDIEVDHKGRLWLVHTYDGTVWELGPDGRVTHTGYDNCVDWAAGNEHRAGDGGAFRDACGEPVALSRGPDGMYVHDSESQVTVRRVGQAIARYPQGESLIPSQDGSEVYRFNAAGVHLQTLDAATERVIRSFSYDAQGRLSAITESDLGTTTFAYDTSGNVNVTGPDGQLTHVDVNADGYASKITDALGAEETYTYTSAGLMTGYTDQLGHSQQFTWSPSGRLTSDESRRGHAQTLGRLEETGKTTVTHTNATGEQTVYETDDDGTGKPKTTITGPDGAVSVSQAASDGGTGTSTTQADGTQIDTKDVADPRWQGASSGSQGTATAPSGKQTTTTRTSQVVRDSGDDANDPFAFTSLIDSLSVDGRTTTSAFDKDARTLTVTSPMGRSSEIEFDSSDRPVRISEPGRDDVTLAYDTRGRPTAVAQSGHTATTMYGTDGYVASETDEVGGTTTFARDGAGQVTSVTGPDGETTGMTYDDAGQVTQVTAPDGRQFGFTYDADGNITQAVRGARAGSGESALVSGVSYDDAGRPSTVTAPSGDTVQMAYDAAGRSSGLSATGGTSTQNSYKTTGGRELETVDTDEGVETAFSYDGPLVTQIATSGDAGAGSSTAVEYGYDQTLRPQSETIDGDTVSVSYNDDEQPTQIGPVAVGYDQATGDPVSVTAGQTVQSVVSNQRGLTQSLAASADGGSGLQAVFADSVVRDGLGRITQRTETVDGVSTTYSYTYDAAGRLTGVSTLGGQTEGYGYDASGGLRSKGVGLLASLIATDGHGRPTADTAGSPVAWSVDGEATSLPRPGGGQTLVSYDGFGRVKTLTAGGSTSEYTYDGLGRRVALTVDGQLTRRYVYGAGLFPLARLDAAGDVIERYIYASRSHVPDVIVRRDGQRLRLICDTLGSVRAVVDADTGAVVQRLSYSAYGQVTQDTNPGAQPFGYKGALADPAAEGAGLVWMGVRAYTPSLGRFLTPDPMGLDAVWNEHDALAGDPINLIDVDGLAPEWLWSVSDAIAGFGDKYTGGGTAAIRDALGWSDNVDQCSGAYKGGGATGLALSMVFPPAGGPVRGAALGAKAARNAENGVNAAQEAARLDKALQGGSRAPELSRPYGTHTILDEAGNVKQVTTYDRHGRRARQYDVGPSTRHGEGSHSFEYYPGAERGDRGLHVPF